MWIACQFNKTLTHGPAQLAESTHSWFNSLALFLVWSVCWGKDCMPGRFWKYRHALSNVCADGSCCVTKILFALFSVAVLPVGGSICFSDESGPSFKWEALGNWLLMGLCDHIIPGKRSGSIAAPFPLLSPRRALGCSKLMYFMGGTWEGAKRNELEAKARKISFTRGCFIGLLNMSAIKYARKRQSFFQVLRKRLVLAYSW